MQPITLSWEQSILGNTWISKLCMLMNAKANNKVDLQADPHI